VSVDVAGSIEDVEKTAESVQKIAAHTNKPDQWPEAMIYCPLNVLELHKPSKRSVNILHITAEWEGVRPHIQGVYVLTCLATGKCYVGSSQDIFARVKCHLAMLLKDEHFNIKLQRAWNKYSVVGGWAWGLLEEVVPEETVRLLAREQHWIRDLGVLAHGFNIALIAGSPMKGRKHSDATKKRCAEANALLDRRDPNYRRKLSEASRGVKNHRYGKSPSPQNREAARLRMLGKKHTPESKKKISESAKLRQGGSGNGFLERNIRRKLMHEGLQVGRGLWPYFPLR
jgi:group I intron endonuclease